MLLFSSAAIFLELPALGLIRSINAATVDLVFQFCIYFLITMNLYFIAKL